MNSSFNAFLKFLATASIIFTLQISNAFGQNIIDEWWTPGFAARVKLLQCENKLCGTIVWSWEDQPSGASDKRPLVGQRIISGMTAETSDSHKPLRYLGSIYNPEDGQTYKATMRLKSNNTLLVEGCVLFICREQIWRRYDSLRSPPVSVIQ
jgi:uncharacterized protein (DUF2147 family)